MKTLIVPISVSLLCISFAQAPLPPANQTDAVKASALSLLNRNSIVPNAVNDVSTVLFDEMNLRQYGLSKEAFAYAYKGYTKLLEKNLISRNEYLTICDLSQSSRRKRLYLVDMTTHQLVTNTFVAHGRNSGGEFASRFSNRPESLQSSLGFYITQTTYIGTHGLALKITGVDPGYNDRALSRNIVIHGAAYIDENWLRHSKYMGRSYGCPAIPARESNSIINTIKNGTCLFIYHPNRVYLLGSKILNG